jgi:hypothetical protein
MHVEISKLTNLKTKALHKYKFLLKVSIFLKIIEIIDTRILNYPKNISKMVTKANTLRIYFSNININI